MATFDIAQVRSALKTLLTTLTGANQKISFVYDYSNPKIEGYPAIIFDVTAEDAQMLDDSNNVRAITFTLWVVNEVAVEGQSGAKDLLDAAVKDVINTLELKSNDTLSGNVDWIMPVIGKRQQVQSPEGLVMYQEIILKCQVSSSIL